MKKLIALLKRTQKKTDPGIDRDPIAKIGRFRMRCNLCNRMYRANSPYFRFCRSCRAEDERYRFSEWFIGSQG